MNTIKVLILASLLISMQVFAAPDIGAGEKRAAVCFACHGKSGISNIPGTPHLAGQERAYLEKALQAYRLGQTRQDPTMTQMAKPLSDQDIKNIAAYFHAQTPMREQQTKVLATEARISPVAKVEVETPAAEAPAMKPTAKSGETVYQASCAACHATGAAGAPKAGDKAAWSPRVAQGQETLYQHALSGFKMMPPKGACSACSDAEVKAAVDFLLGELD